jgi:endonuclease/exonuclease/phosphatase family metal-dependent hydrolase
VKGGLIVIALVCAAAIVLFIGLLVYLSISEFRPQPVEPAEVTGNAAQPVPLGIPIQTLSWNIGYAALGAEADFFMDGGKMTRPASASVVRANLTGIRDTLRESGAEIILLQETDVHAKRSYYIDETAFLSEKWEGSCAFAHNFSVPFVPIPVLDPIGEVRSGLLSLNSFVSTEAVRMSLPVPFKWPVRAANLKRCLLIERMPVADTKKELVLVNLHLEAYSSNEDRDAQMNELENFLEMEYARGNYCVAGGDFNKNFPNIDPVMFRLKNTAHFTPGQLSQETLPAGWRFITDTSVPTSRLLNEPYSGAVETTQVYAIDGFLLSPNVEALSVKTIDARFTYSDHNPVMLSFILKS